MVTPSRGGLRYGMANSGWLYYVPALLLATITLWLRVDSPDNFAARHLWAEDGDTFLNQASKLGTESILAPYAGYLHLFPRLFAFASTSLPLEKVPSLLLSGWTVAYYFMIVSACRLMKAIDASPWFAGIAAALLILQPHNGEVLFNITNAQWLLGTAVAFIAFTPATRVIQPGPLSLIALAVACLTGPFSVLVAAVLAGMSLMFRLDWRIKWPTYIVIFTAATIQSWMLTHSARMAKIETSFDLPAWILGLWRFLSFGAEQAFTIALVLAMLSVQAYGLLKASDRIRIVYLGLLGTAVIMALSSMYAVTPAVMVVSPFGMNRYTWIPYAILLLAGCVATCQLSRVASVLYLILVIGFCFSLLKTKPLHELHFKHFVRLSRATHTIIPINPVWPLYPGWHITSRPGHGNGESGISIAFDHSSVHVDGIEASFGRGTLDYQVNSPDGSITLRTHQSCGNSPSIGVEVDIQRDTEGEVKLFWSDNDTFSDRYAFSRWYPAGQHTTQFAFSGFPGDIFLRLQPQDRPGNGVIRNIRLFCLS